MKFRLKGQQSDPEKLIQLQLSVVRLKIATTQKSEKHWQDFHSKNQALVTSSYYSY